jgi:hypothetical protein
MRYRKKNAGLAVEHERHQKFARRMRLDGAVKIAVISIDFIGFPGQCLLLLGCVAETLFGQVFGGVLA